MSYLVIQVIFQIDLWYIKCLKYFDHIRSFSELQDKPNDTNLSKKLSWLLRHGARKEGLSVSDSGFIKVSDVLQHRAFKNNYTINDVIRVVETNDKQRFAIKYNDNNELEICANQGHSIKVSHEKIYKHWK